MELTAGGYLLPSGVQVELRFGHLTTEDVEFDLAVGTVLRIVSGADAGCATPLSGGLSIDRPGAYAAVGIEQPGGVQIVAVPLG